MHTFHHLHAWLQQREAKRLIQREITAHEQLRKRYSGAQYGIATQRNALPELHRSAWFALAALIVAFGAGYVVADDQRIEQLDNDKQQAQLSALCAQPWPDAPGAAAARLRACGSTTQQ